MAKAKHGSKENPLTKEDMERIQRRTDAMKIVHDKNYEIEKADLKDLFCNYKFILISGPGSGASHSVTDSTNVSYPMLRTAYEKLHVHFAAICGHFDDAGIEIKDIDKMHDHDITGLVMVTGFEISGPEDGRKVKLTGTRYVSSSSGRVETKTHKVPIDNLGGYKWYNELKQAIEDVKLEVALYKEGFYVPIEDDSEEDPGQEKMEFDKESVIKDEIFEGGKVS